jgi:hypothetical protein
VQLPSKEALKSRFTLLVGNPDSMIKTFNKPMIIDKKDIDKLDEQICNKLGIHQIEASKTAFDVTLSNNTIMEFERWRGSDLNFAIPEYVTTVSIRWDFMVQLPHYRLPQRHVLTVRIGGTMRPAQLMQAIFSQDPEEAKKFDLHACPLYCRVDFINQILSQELVNTVDTWQQGAREATGLLPTWLRKRWVQRTVNTFLRYSVPLWAAILAIIYLFKHFDSTRLNQPLLVVDLRDVIAWIFASVIGIVGLFGVSKYVARHSLAFLRRHSPHTRFQLTSGDTNRYEADKRKALNTIVKYGLAFVFALICNVVAAYVSAKLFSSK